jgi:hypothetical protein
MTVRKISTILALVAACWLSACSGDVRSTKLTPELLEDQAKLQRVVNRLEPQERKLFAQYLMNRAVMASPLGAMGSTLVTSAGKDPATVGEAIEVVRRADDLSAKRDVLIKARDAKEAVLDAKRKKLNDVAEAAGWASKEVDAANVVVDEIKAMRQDYDARIAAIK